MKISIYDCLHGQMEYIGYIEYESTAFDAEKCWELCNWMDVGKEVKPKNLYADIYSCSHGICFYHPEEKKYYLALSCGWLIGDNQIITKYIKSHNNKKVWC